MTEKDYQLVRSYQVFRSRKQWAVNVVGTDSDGQSIKSTGHSCSNIFLIIINHHRRRRQSMIAASIAASIAAAAAAASWLMNYRIFLQHESITMTRVIVIVIGAVGDGHRMVWSTILRVSSIPWLVDCSRSSSRDLWIPIQRMYETYRGEDRTATIVVKPKMNALSFSFLSSHRSLGHRWQSTALDCRRSEKRTGPSASTVRIDDGNRYR